ncbi:hypothetical protein SAMN05428974_1344 [Sphingopyxis sp. YR583]|uniref:TRADD-N-associated membrane domain-containing protein n=1 Tax=Sphingopyxis sp. YR583 TaxID=1881047 RepID=UPI0008A7CB1B|nr:hypothetical protein [Sphingopyxis sp. YR583]SEH15070.1 hypothetical protein SAMN05428974_1344 [Sphingopyxis sp. YR583]
METEPAIRHATQMLLGGWRHLSPRLQKFYIAGLFMYVLGFIIALLAFSGALNLSNSEVVGAPAAGIAFIGLVTISSLSTNARRAAEEEKVEAAEVRARENPDRSQYTWDVARLKLESYLDRNLGHVTAIFVLTTVVMLFGMALVGLGVWRAIDEPGAITMPILAAASGVLVQAIGGTFLIIYRSTMDQAKNYVVVLERINAVGMSINIIESIEAGDATSRNKARAELARELLGMYSQPSRPAAE